VSILNPDATLHLSSMPGSWLLITAHKMIKQTDEFAQQKSSTFISLFLEKKQKH
jgi:type II secretory pathway component PulL